MALVGVELETLVSEQDALTTRPPPYAFKAFRLTLVKRIVRMETTEKAEYL